MYIENWKKMQYVGFCLISKLKELRTICHDATRVDEQKPLSRLIACLVNWRSKYFSKIAMNGGFLNKFFWY